MRLLSKVCFCLLLISPLWLGAQTLRDPQLHFFDDSFGDLQEELQLTEAEGKKALLIMFETTDCPWCTRMKQSVLNRVVVQDYYKQHFRVLTLNAESSASIIDFSGEETTEAAFSLSKLRVRATPVFAFFSPSGELLTKHIGITKDADEFLLLGKFVLEGHYVSQRFSQYRRAQQS